MRTNKSQVVNSGLIIAGGAILLYEISRVEENTYLLILGLVLLMFGLYKATNHWVYTKDDHKKEDDQDLKNED